jgi:Domain of unknown function (DUF4760)
LSDVWSALGALSAATGTLIVAVAAVYAYLQVREAKLARNVQTIFAIDQLYQTEELKDIRRKLYNHELGDLSQLGTSEQLDNLLRQVELLAILVERKILDFELVAAAYPHSIVRVWEETKSYIVNRRRTSPHYAVHFERLVRRFPETKFPRTARE